ncbi:uncharacterized protein BO95DRAFT_434790 [Aspergillus brunneoviolaceus CBS 621.78]|uniref:Uncharacterized protein n=1 Tax=Aspergillus brunneoviolaceus CBS 621.78 TaxID=1450534 RepID=A0ACD1FZS8_9EURO|nr:hypothetical protein BO95DRAFT_434790 [Aspergillus brunneoviolaceus CBS 621.78]RAH42485.1 hypothetical protein BO95DRAFT_434790 [Aspergillus brunneoviolaceus CBS 621.78]
MCDWDMSQTPRPATEPKHDDGTGTCAVSALASVSTRRQAEYPSSYSWTSFAEGRNLVAMRRSRTCTWKVQANPVWGSKENGVSAFVSSTLVLTENCTTTARPDLHEYIEIRLSIDEGTFEEKRPTRWILTFGPQVLQQPMWMSDGGQATSTVVPLNTPQRL